MLTIEQSNQRINELISQWKSNFTPLADSVNFIRGEISRRAFGGKSSAGKNTAGATLPTVPYSTTPIYVSNDSIKRKVPSFQIGKRGTKIKSAYFPQGYGQLKDAVGRNPIELTGTLFSAFANNPILASGQNVSIEIPDDQAGKVKGLESKYGTIFQMSDEEEELFTDELAQQIADAINKALQ
jgi:hypothetical protein